MNIQAKNPATTPIPVQLSATEFTACIFPHLSMPKRGPQCPLGSHRLFNLMVWVLYTAMPWTCVPVPQDAHGKPAIHDTTVYRALAKWAHEGSLEQAFVASVGHLADAKKLDLSIRQGDGTHTVAQKGAMAWGTQATSTRRARKSSP